MPYRLLLPTTSDLIPADVHDALQPFGAAALADRGCAWQLPGSAAPGVSADAAPIIVRLLPPKAIVARADEPTFRIPKDTTRALEVIAPTDAPTPADCQRVHACATALAEKLQLGVLNPYRGMYCASADAYRDGLTDPPAADAVRVRTMSRQTKRRTSDRTRPATVLLNRQVKVPSRRTTTDPRVYESRQGALSRLANKLRGTKRYELALPPKAKKGHVQMLRRRLRECVPMAQVSLDRRRRAILIEAPSTPLVQRTVCEFIDRYGFAAAPTG